MISVKKLSSVSQDIYRVCLSLKGATKRQLIKHTKFSQEFVEAGIEELQANKRLYLSNRKYFCKSPIPRHAKRIVECFRNECLDSLCDIEFFYDPQEKAIVISPVSPDDNWSFDLVDILTAASVNHCVQYVNRPRPMIKITMHVDRRLLNVVIFLTPT